ncbi:MAG: F0F1 ATP synthase subunit B [Treponema sp.]|jgi:F-type H+-transporting ATPase subunit b|nr:F0F1 ATP synthase subunit B [Treponema sp.]
MLDFSVTFVITLINIAILFFILRAILFKPVTKFIENRAAMIRSDIEQAEKDKIQAKALLEQYEEKLRSAGEEAEALIKAARKTAEEQAARIIAEGRETAALLVANSRDQLDTERRAARAVFKAEAAALVVAAAGRLLTREMNQEDNLRFAGLLLEELGKN